MSLGNPEDRVQTGKSNCTINLWNNFTEVDWGKVLTEITLEMSIICKNKV